MASSFGDRSGTPGSAPPGRAADSNAMRIPPIQVESLSTHLEVMHYDCLSVIQKLQSLWAFRGGLGAVRKPLGVVLGHLGATWGSLRASWGDLGSLLGPLGTALSLLEGS